MIRKCKLHGSYSEAEIAAVEAQARKAKLEPSAYLRQLLRLPAVKMGRPEKKNGHRQTKRGERAIARRV